MDRFVAKLDDDILNRLQDKIDKSESAEVPHHKEEE